MTAREQCLPTTGRCTYDCIKNRTCTSSALPPQVEHGSDKSSHLVEPHQIPFQQETRSACVTLEQIL
ncbi:hypothetical protein LEMLEM_LOCUS6667, partial [Lemmus lemmus]